MSRTMKAAVFEGNGVFGVKEVPVPAPAVKEVLVKIEAGSICGSDLHVLSVPPGQYAKPGTVLGHEFLGRIEELGSEVSTVKKGDRVIIEPIVPCGMCDACRRNLTNLCEKPSILGQTVDGGFAEYCVVPEEYLHPVAEEIPAKIAALAEPIACVMHGMMELNPQPYERVVLYGAGAIGLIFYNMLKSYGVRHLAVCETMDSRIEDAKRCGVDFIINPMQEDVGAVLKERWGGGPDVGIDAVGAGAVFEQLVGLMNKGGRILIFGQNNTQTSTVYPSQINTKQLKIFGTMAVYHSIPAAIEMMNGLEDQLAKIVTHELPLDQFEDGIRLLREKKALKVVIYP